MGVGISDLYFTRPDALDLASEQHNASLDDVNNVIVVACFSVARKQPVVLGIFRVLHNV